MLHPGATVAERSYEQHRDYVLAVLAQRCSWLDASDREAVFHDAYMVLLEKERAGELELDSMHPRQVRAYLTLTAVRKGVDESKRAEHKRAVPLMDGVLEQADPDASPEQRVSAEMDSAPVREIVAELPERRQVIVKLRFYFDRTPEEIQRYLAIGERVYRRELERAIRQIAERYELVRAGEWCESRRSLVLAYVAGIAGPNRAREARAHLDSCPACAHLAAELYAAARSVAAAVPLPALQLDEGWLPRVSELAAAARDALADVGVSAKQHGLQLVTRVDPGSAQYAAAARPGNVVATVASCIAAAGGATYCVVAEVPAPIRSALDPLKRVVTEDERDKPRRESARRAERKPTVRKARAITQPPPSRTAPTLTSTARPSSSVKFPNSAKSTNPSPRRSSSSPPPRKGEFQFEATRPAPAPTRAPTTSPAPDSSLRGGPLPPVSKPRTSEPPAGAPGVFERR